MFQRVLAAERQQAAADECDIARGVEGEHLAQTVAQPDLGVCLHWTGCAASLECDPSLLEQMRHAVEALRMARNDHRQ